MKRNFATPRSRRCGGRPSPTSRASRPAAAIPISSRFARSAPRRTAPRPWPWTSASARIATSWTSSARHAGRDVGPGPHVSLDYQEPAAASERTRAIVWLDRPIHRPGDVVDFAGLVRRFDGRRLADHTAATRRGSSFASTMRRESSGKDPANCRRRGRCTGGSAFRRPHGWARAGSTSTASAPSRTCLWSSRSSASRPTRSASRWPARSTPAVSGSKGASRWITSPGSRWPTPTWRSFWRRPAPTRPLRPAPLAPTASSASRSPRPRSAGMRPSSSARRRPTSRDSPTQNATT